MNSILRSVIKAMPVIIPVIVLIVAVVVIWKIITFLERHFPRHGEAAPVIHMLEVELRFDLPGDSYGEAFIPGLKRTPKPDGQLRVRQFPNL